MKYIISLLFVLLISPGISAAQNLGVWIDIRVIRGIYVDYNEHEEEILKNYLELEILEKWGSDANITFFYNYDDLSAAMMTAGTTPSNSYFRRITIRTISLGSTVGTVTDFSIDHMLLTTLPNGFDVVVTIPRFRTEELVGKPPFKLYDITEIIADEYRRHIQAEWDNLGR